MRAGAVVVVTALALGSLVGPSAGAGAQEDGCQATDEERALGEPEPRATVVTGDNSAVTIGTDALSFHSRGVVWITRDRGATDHEVCDQPALSDKDAALVMSDVAVSDDGTLVAIGTQDERPAWWRSVDGGDQWTRKRFPASIFRADQPEERSIDAVAWTGTEFLAAGLDGYHETLGLWTSPDGRKWSHVQGSKDALTAPGDGYEVSGLFRGTALGIAVNDDGTVVVAAKYALSDVRRRVLFLVRPAGKKAWIQARAPKPDGEPDQLAFGIVATGAGFVAIGVEGSGDNSDDKTMVAFTSADGRKWTKSTGLGFFGDEIPHALAASPATGVLVGLESAGLDTLPQLWQSTDGGETWSEVPGFGGDDMDLTALAAFDGSPASYLVGGTIFAQHSDDPVDETFGSFDALFLLGEL